MSNKKAPIVLFVYNRPLHAQQVLNSLAENVEANESVLYVFCDGVKGNATKDDINKIAEVRKIANKEDRFKSVIVIEQLGNKGLDDSIIDGVTEIINKYGKVIVLEDDLEVSPFFLSYMNDSLERYEDNAFVGQIGACNFFACGKKYPEYFFVPIPDCLGWATWENRWNAFNPNVEVLYAELTKSPVKLNVFNVYGAYSFSEMLADQLRHDTVSWDIRWQAICVLKGWLTLYPNPAMSNHIESEEATHVNKNIIPPLVLNQPNFFSIEAKENREVIKALKLGYSGKGDYYGKLKRQSKKKRIKKMIKLFVPSLVINTWRNLK